MTADWDDVLDQLSAALDRLPPKRQAVFAALAAAGLSPAFREFMRDTGTCEPRLLDRAVGLVIDEIADGASDEARQLAVTLETCTPHDEDADHALLGAAQSAASAAVAALRARYFDEGVDPALVEQILDPAVEQATQREHGVVQLGSGEEEKAWFQRLPREPEVAAAVQFCGTCLADLAVVDRFPSSDVLQDFKLRSSVLLPE